MEIPDVTTETKWMEGTNGVTLEHEKEDEVRIFCVLFNQRTDKYRLTSSDAVIIEDAVVNGTFPDLINEMIKIAKEVGETITKEQIKI